MSFRKLFQLALIAATLSCAQAARAQLQGICESRINITSVKYLGKSSGDDQFEVRWTAEAASACIKFGAAEAKMPPAQQDSLNTPALAGYTVHIRLKRRQGGIDEGQKITNLIINAGGNVTSIVNVHRPVLALDPESATVTITTLSGGLTQKRAIVAGPGLPNLSTATQTFHTFTIYPNPIPTLAECFPDLQITGLIFTTGNGAAPDALTINWNPTDADTGCIAGGVLLTSISVEGHHAGSHAVFSEFW